MWFLLIAGLLAVICLILVFIKLRKKRSVHFLMDNSIALKKLIDINNKYVFHNSIKNFDEKHIYDNERFYDNISCEDYLIYQLQYKKYDVKKEIEYIHSNKAKYELYCKEISEINDF